MSLVSLMVCYRGLIFVLPFSWCHSPSIKTSPWSQNNPGTCRCRNGEKDLKIKSQHKQTENETTPRRQHIIYTKYHTKCVQNTTNITIRTTRTKQIQCDLTFLLCGQPTHPGWCAHLYRKMKIGSQNRWDESAHTNTHAHTH